MQLDHHKLEINSQKIQKPSAECFYLRKGFQLEPFQNVFMNSSLSNETLKKLFSYSVGVFCHSTFKNKSMLTRAHFSGHSDDSRSDCIIIMVSTVITVQHIKRAWINPDFNFSLLYTKTLQNKTNKQTQKNLVRMLPKQQKRLYIIRKQKYFCLLCFVLEK